MANITPLHWPLVIEKTVPTLATIPPELRLHIYAHLFANFDAKFCTTVPAILHTSRLIRYEALPVLQKDISEAIDTVVQRINESEETTVASLRPGQPSLRAFARAVKTVRVERESGQTWVELGRILGVEMSTAAEEVFGLSDWW